MKNKLILYSKWSIRTSFFLLTLSASAFQEYSLEKKSIDSLNTIAYQIYYSATDSSRNISLEALERATTISYDLGQAKANHTLGICYGIYGDFGKSFAYLMKANELYKNLDNKEPLGRILRNIAIISINEGNYQQALKYAEESFQIFKELGEDNQAASSLFSVASILGELNHPQDEVLSRFEEAEEILRKNELLNELAQGLNLKADYFFNKNELTKAIKTYMATLDLLANLKRPYAKGYSYQGLAKAYLKKDDLDSMEWATEKALEIYLPERHKNSLETVYMLRVNLFRIKGQYDRAFESLVTAKAYSDSIQRDKKEKELSLLRMEFDTEKKNQEIASLSQEKAIRELEINQKNTLLIILVIGAIVFILIFYLLFKSRNSKQKQLHTELEHRFLRSQLNPHFIFNALASIQNYMLKNSAQESGMYLAKFSKLMRQILENSREEFIPIEEEIKMLKNYIDVHQLNKSKPFTYEVKVDDHIDTEAETIPPMFVQPFVENAIEHGLPEGETGRILISFAKKDKFIQVEILDNGKGVSVASPSSNHKSLSSQIIKERIDLFNLSLKNKIQFVVNDVRGEGGTIIGTCVQLDVPFSHI